MVEVNRLLLESTEVTRGRTLLGTAGLAEREGIAATQRTIDNAVVSAGLAARAIDQGRSLVEASGRTLASIDEEFGQARRTTEAIQTVVDTTRAIDARVNELLRNPDIDPLNLATMVQAEIQQLRNAAVARGAQLGQREQAYIINKLAGVQSSRVASARTAGYQRETDEKKAEYFRLKFVNDQRKFAPDTTLQERLELHNDLIVMTDRYAFYLGQAAAEKIIQDADFQLRKQQIIEEIMINPQAGLALVPQMGFTPEQELAIQRQAENLLAVEHQKEQREIQLENQRRKRFNDERFNEAISEQAAGGNPGQILSDLENEVADDPILTEAFLKYKAFVQNETRFQKFLETEGASDPDVLFTYLTRATTGDFENADDVIAQARVFREQGLLNSADAVRGVAVFTEFQRREQREELPQINRRVNEVAELLNVVFVGRDPLGQPVRDDELTALRLRNDLHRRLLGKLERREPIDFDQEINQFLQDRLPILAPNLAGKTLGDVSPFDSLEEARRLGASGIELRRLSQMDRLLKDAARINADGETARQEAERTRLQNEQEQLRQELRDQIGAERLQQEEQRRLAQVEQEIRLESLRERFNRLAAEAPQPPPRAAAPAIEPPPRFRVREGVFVPLEPLGPPSPADEFEQLVQDTFNVQFADVVQHLDARTIEQHKQRIRTNLRRALIRQRRQQMLEQEREAIIERAEQERAVREQLRQLEEVQRRLNELNQPRTP